MKEIDFLPQWYMDNRRQKLSVQRQCISLSIIFLVMILSNALASRSISRANAELAITEKQRFDAERVVQEYGRLLKQVTALKKVVSFSDESNARPEVANLLGELSAVMSESVVLGQVAFMREAPQPSDSTLPDDPNQIDLDPSLSMGAGPLCIRIQGWAQDTRSISTLMTALEESPYFHEVHLGYSKEKAFTVAPSSVLEDTTVSGPPAGRLEFEIGFVTESPQLPDTDTESTRKNRVTVP